jgi:hypothetical protein
MGAKKGKGTQFWKTLFEDMMKSETRGTGFATIALKDHWSPWFKKNQIEKLGFEPTDSLKVAHKMKREGWVFSIYLMWMSKTKNARLPQWDKQRLLEGETFCIAHPLYRPQTWKGNIFEIK